MSSFKQLNLYIDYVFKNVHSVFIYCSVKIKKHISTVTHVYMYINMYVSAHKYNYNTHINYLYNLDVYICM